MPVDFPSVIRKKIQEWRMDPVGELNLGLGIYEVREIGFEPPYSAVTRPEKVADPRFGIETIGQILDYIDEANRDGEARTYFPIETEPDEEDTPYDIQARESKIAVRATSENIAGVMLWLVRVVVDKEDLSLKWIIGDLKRGSEYDRDDTGIIFLGELAAYMGKDHRVVQDSPSSDLDYRTNQTSIKIIRVPAVTNQNSHVLLIIKTNKTWGRSLPGLGSYSFL